MKIAGEGTIVRGSKIYTLIHMSITITMPDNRDVKALTQLGFL